MLRGNLKMNFLVLSIFFITGLTGLAYELVWIRLLILSFGSTQFAITTVLSTFMAGLALGSIIFGRVVDKYRYPLRVYAAIEIVLGVYCVLSPWIFSMAREAYLALSPVTGDATYQAWFEPVQFVMAFIVLIVPTTLMGGTLPALVKYLASLSGRIGYYTAIPYAINTFGAVTGCLATGLFALYYIGINSTVYIAGIIDILAGALLLALYWKERSAGTVGVAQENSEPMSESGGSSRKKLNLIIISAFTLSGFCSLAYEVLWTRVLSLVLGSSVYAFTIMLATFLVGLGLGSIAFAPFVDRCKKPILWFSALEAIIGLFALASVFIYRELPFIFFNLKDAFAERFWLFLIIEFLIAAAVMIVPTLSMGAIFPLVNRIYAQGFSHSVGKKVGDIYFFNTTGAIVGSAIGGFILIPFIGVQNGVVLTAGLNILISIVLLYQSGITMFGKLLGSAAFATAFVFMTVALPQWEKMAMTMGLYINQYEMDTKNRSFKDWSFNERLLYYKEGLNAIITVRGSGPNLDIISYQANGKQEARSESGRPSWSWSILGHIPMMLHNSQPKEALLVGLGSGITLGAMEYYPINGIDVVELESGVVDAARFFSESNNNALDDPRVRLHLTDGRSFLSTASKKYDIIISGVSDPWISGVSNLFTYDYFEELKNRLNDDGIVAVWFSNYKSTSDDFKIGLNSFAAVFPNISAWFHYRAALDLVIIGSVKPHSFDMQRLRSIFADPKISTGLARIDIKDPYDIFTLFLSGDRDLRRYIGNARINSDERPILEFSLPKNLYKDVSGADRVREIIAITEDITPPVNINGDEVKDFYLNIGKSYNRYTFRITQASKAFEKVLEIDPSNQEAALYLNNLKKEMGTK
jgi:spermidine synthase